MSRCGGKLLIDKYNDTLYRKAIRQTDILINNDRTARGLLPHPKCWTIGKEVLLNKIKLHWCWRPRNKREKLLRSRGLGVFGFGDLIQGCSCQSKNFIISEIKDKKMRLFKGHLAIYIERNSLPLRREFYIRVNRFGLKLCFARGVVWFKSLRVGKSARSRRGFRFAQYSLSN